ncbi:hypothetical protein [Sphingobacterium spiritivorum]|uniref:hypothetical protein n=1 Tax=Sphingobacterium spiritivorum TaxID=258 RepID=UPI003DA5DBCB
MTLNDTLIAAHHSFTGYFGVAECDITPPLDIYARNWGAAPSDQASGLHRPLLMQCVLFQTEDEISLVMITADLGWWKNEPDERNLRHYILQQTDLQEEQLLFCLSHTHSGPVICTADADKPGGEYIRPYLESLAVQSVELIQQAQHNLIAGTLTWTYGKCDLATKRDLKIDDSYLIGYNPSDRADDTVLVGCIRDNANQTLATLVNYACHPTTFAHENSLLSPDFVGAMREEVTAKTGGICMFLQGASGDLAPMEQYVSDPAIVDRHGRRLGFAVLSALESLPVNNQGLYFKEALVSGAPLALWKTCDLPPQQLLTKKIVEVVVDYKKLPTVAEITAEYEACTDRVLKDRLWRKLNTRKSIGDQKQAVIRLWVWQLGNSVIVGQANEAYSIIQEQIRAAFPDKSVAFINIANGYVGYLPPAELYGLDIYAVWQTPYAKGSLEILINKTIQAIQELK